MRLLLISCGVISNGSDEILHRLLCSQQAVAHEPHMVPNGITAPQEVFSMIPELLTHRVNVLKTNSETHCQTTKQLYTFGIMFLKSRVYACRCTTIKTKLELRQTMLSNCPSQREVLETKFRSGSSSMPDGKGTVVYPIHGHANRRNMHIHIGNLFRSSGNTNGIGFLK